MKPSTATTIGRIVGAALAALLGAGGAVAAARISPAPPPSAISSADIEGLRRHIDKKFDEQGMRIGAVETGVATINGYIAAQKEAALERAVAGGR